MRLNKLNTYEQNSLFSTLQKKLTNYWIWQNVLSGRQWILEHYSSSSLNVRSAVLHSRFGFRMRRSHFNIGCLSRKVHWTFTSELWLPGTQVCKLGFLEETDIPVTAPDFPSRTSSRIGNTRYYIHSLPQSCLNHFSLSSYDDQHQLR